MADSLPTRESLLQRVCRTPDEESWEEFLHYYRDYLYGIARKTGLSHEDTEEVVQNVCVNILKALPQFEYDRNRGRFRSWLATIITNDARMLLRKRKGDLERLDKHRQEAERAYLSRCDPDIPGQVAEEEWRAYVTRLAWEKVRPHFRQHYLKAFEMLSKGTQAADVAAELGLNRSSVYVYRKRIEDRLREEVMRLNRELD